ncbi:MAG: hypothetical protein DHS20C10_14060 [marine bacterium B5-7]|nr:MAG: hypothetical protein DHS20C10_14060 [marine bacterium B5-7]
MVQWYLTAPLNRKQTESIYEILPGTPVAVWAEDMHAKGLLGRPLLFRILLRLTQQGPSIQAGEYALEKDLTPLDWLGKLTKGHVLLHRFTIVEGWTAKQLLTQLAGLEKMQHSLANQSVQAVAATLNLSRPLEGQFFPNTYYYAKGDTDITLLMRAHLLLQTHLQKAWESRAVGLPYQTPYEALVMGSLIERETAAPEERAEIAGVLVHRLQKGMKLQVDPTVIYALGDTYQGHLTKKNMRVKSPFNTYLHPGLPPTPIAMVGEASLLAAMHPVLSDKLYYVANGKGRHTFSATLKAHRKAIVVTTIPVTPALSRGLHGLPRHNTEIPAQGRNDKLNNKDNKSS